jgi:hypothetical protein
MTGKRLSVEVAEWLEGCEILGRPGDHVAIWHQLGRGHQLVVRLATALAEASGDKHLSAVLAWHRHYASTD